MVSLFWLTMQRENEQAGCEDRAHRSRKDPCGQSLRLRMAAYQSIAYGSGAKRSMPSNIGDQRIPKGHTHTNELPPNINRNSIKEDSESLATIIILHVHSATHSCLMALVRRRIRDERLRHDLPPSSVLMPVLLDPLDTQDSNYGCNDLLSILQRTEDVRRSDGTGPVARVGGCGDNERLVDQFTIG